MSETGDPALIGRRIAHKFVVEKFLGGGSMGAVYRARDTSLDRNVALKVMHPSFAVDPTFITRFRREARATGRLDHPSSLRVIEFGEELDGLLYIAMEYLEGRDLHKVIYEDWPLPDTRVADILMKALAALSVAHDNGVIHRDLKPENIMILDRKDDEGHDIVKVCDFGIAKITEKEEEGDAISQNKRTTTTVGLVVGTPEYMSPEQARGEKLDARSDLYSMGVILYQMLTGRTPFVADTPLAIVLQHIGESPEPPSAIYRGVHTGLETICMRALSKAQDDRYQTAKEMRKAIKAAIEGRPLPLDTNASTMPGPAVIGEGAVDDDNTPVTTAAIDLHPPAAADHPSMEPGKRNLTLAFTAVPSSQARAKSKSQAAASLIAVSGLLGVVVLGLLGALFLNDRAEPEKRAARDHQTITATISTPTSDSPQRKMPDPQPSQQPLSFLRTLATATAQRDTIEPIGIGTPYVKPVDPEPEQTTTAATEHPPIAAPLPTRSAPADERPPARATALPFDAMTCRATLGSKRSTSGSSAKDLSLSGDTAGAWTTCARRSINERPSRPISATVHVRFNDNRVFKGSSCTTGCTPALSACIASSTTARMMSFTARSGDLSGDPEFDVPVTFTCD